jgi:hypothetical protein
MECAGCGSAAVSERSERTASVTTGSDVAPAASSPMSGSDGSLNGRSTPATSSSLPRATVAIEPGPIV